MTLSWDVANIFIVPSTQLLLLAFTAEPPFLAALAKLLARVAWSTADWALMFGWSINTLILQ
jgi:hypothetical protein